MKKIFFAVVVVLSVSSVACNNKEVKNQQVETDAEVVENKANEEEIPTENHAVAEEKVSEHKDNNNDSGIRTGIELNKSRKDYHEIHVDDIDKDIDAFSGKYNED